MKRLFMALLFMTACFALIGCGAATTGEVATTAPTTATATTTTEAAEEPLGNDDLIEEIVARIKNLFE